MGKNYDGQMIIPDEEWKRRWPSFSKKEMQCRDGCGMLPEPEIMDILQAVRSKLNSPMSITSGARCPIHNNAVSGTGFKGPHTLGLAADIKIYGERAFKLIELAQKNGATGIGVHQKGEHYQRYVHIDCVPRTDLVHPRPWIWSY